MVLVAAILITTEALVLLRGKGCSGHLAWASESVSGNRSRNLGTKEFV